jgi:hypothetical protein
VGVHIGIGVDLPVPAAGDRAGYPVYYAPAVRELLFYDGRSGAST